MAANDLVITITARDQATQTLRNVQKEVDQTADVLKIPKDAIDAMRESFARLGEVLPGISTSFQTLGRIMSTSVAGAAAGVVTSLLAYGTALNRVADEQARFQRVLSSLNADAIRGELARVNDELDRMADIGTRIGNDAGTWTGALQSFLSRLQALPQAARETFLGAETPEAQRQQILTILGGVLGAQEGATQTQLQAAIAGTQQRAILFQQQRRLNVGDVAGAQALQAQLDAADRRERDLALRALQQRQGLERAEAIRQGLPLGPLTQTQALQQQALAGELEISLQRQRIAREEQLRAVALQQQTRPLEETKQTNEALAAQFDALQKIAQLEAARAEQFGDLDTLNQKLAEVTTNYVQQAGAAREALLVAQQVEQAQAVSRQARPEEIAQLSARQAEQLRAFDLQQNAGLAQLQAVGRDAREQILNRRFLQESTVPGQGFEAATAGLTPEDQAKGAEVARKLETDRLQIASDTAKVMADQVGLTRDQRIQLEQQVIEADRRLRISEAQGDEDQIALANLEAQTKQANLLNEELLRTDAGAGLVQGFRDVSDEAAAAGDRMRSSIVNAYRDINQSFSDIVVEGLFNQGERIGDIGKELGKRLVAGFTDQLFAGVTAKIFQSLGSALGLPSTGAARPLATAIPTLSSPFALAGAAGTAGTAIVGAATEASAASGATSVVGSSYLAQVTGGAAASPALVTGGTISAGTAAAQSSGVSIIGQGLGIAKDVASGFFGTSLSATGVIAAYQAGGLAGISAAQSLVAAGISESAAVSTVAATAAEGGAAIGVGGSVTSGAAAPAYGAGAAAGAGALAATVAAGVLSAAALGYTAYSAYQSGDVAGGAIGGAVSGAALGTVIYPGIGTVVGLIVGAAIGAGAGSAGKNEQQVELDRQRHAAERQRKGAIIYQQLMGAIQGGVDHEDIAAQSLTSGENIGELLLGIAILNVQGALAGDPWDWAPSENGRKTVEILYGLGVTNPNFYFTWDRINSTGELIATWHNPGSEPEKTQAGQTPIAGEIAKNAEALLAAFVAKQGSTVLVGYDEQLSTGLRGAAGRVTRETLITSDRVRAEAQGRDLFVVGGTLDALTDDQAQRILERLAKVDRDRDLQILRIESDFGATVSVGHLTA